MGNQKHVLREAKLILDVMRSNKVYSQKEASELACGFKVLTYQLSTVLYDKGDYAASFYVRLTLRKPYLLADYSRYFHGIFDAFRRISLDERPHVLCWKQLSEEFRSMRRDPASWEWLRQLCLLCISLMHPQTRECVALVNDNLAAIPEIHHECFCDIMVEAQKQLGDIEEQVRWLERGVSLTQVYAANA